MSEKIKIRPIQMHEFYPLSIMVGDLLNEIMEKIDRKVFNFNLKETEERARGLIKDGKYWIFVAEDSKLKEIVGFVSLYESYALYTEGSYGTMPELFVKSNWRSKSVGQELLMKVSEFAKEKGWRRIEVTTPPLPEFDRALSFYKNNGFEITGGRKLKVEISMPNKKINQT